MAKISTLPPIAAPVGNEQVVLFDGEQARRAPIDALQGASGLMLPCRATVTAPNRWRLTIPNRAGLADQAMYRFQPPETPTGPIVVSIAGIAGLEIPVVFENGAPVGSNAGILATWQITLRYDQQGNVLRLVDNAYTIPAVQGLLATRDILDNLTTLRDTPWGDVTAARQVIVTSCGSSVFTTDSARQGGCPPGNNPADFTCAELEREFPLNGYSFLPDARAHGGHVFGEFLGQLAESSAWRNGLSAFCLVGGGMNDFQVSNFDTNQTFPWAKTHVIAIIEANRTKGIKTLLTTSVHPNTATLDYAGFFRTNPGFPAIYPRYIAGPVDPERDQFPPASQSRGLRDMTGGGVLSEYDVRFWAGNRMLREVARLYPNDVILLDAEWSWFRYGVEVHGVRALYGENETVHPNELGHQVSYQRVLRAFARDVAMGRVKRIYLGD
jgi:hypothetical protein